jgi:hypothetical protein
MLRLRTFGALIVGFITLCGILFGTGELQPDKIEL